VRQRGRPPLPRGVFSFQDSRTPTPFSVVVDTSFVVEALLASQPLHSACADYLAQLAGAGAELVFSRLMIVELRETVFQLALKERHPKDWKRFRHDGRARRRAARLMEEANSAWGEVLESFVWTEVEVGDVVPRIDRFMSSHGLASYDAVHAATAEATGVSRIVTIDAGFAAVPESELTIYTDGTRVASCRSRRIP
jgi:predicted nucleic acid-binding protein